MSSRSKREATTVNLRPTSAAAMAVDSEESDWDEVLVDSKLLAEGKAHLFPAAKAWRRFTLKALVVAKNVDANKLVQVATSKRWAVEVGDCKHPWYARRAGGNRYGRYVHCVICRDRLVFVRTDEKDKGKAEKASSSKNKPPYETAQPRAKAEAKVPAPRGKPGKTLPATPSASEMREEALTEAIKGMGSVMQEVASTMKEIKDGQKQLMQMATPK